LREKEGAFQSSPNEKKKEGGLSSLKARRQKKYANSFSGVREKRETKGALSRAFSVLKEKDAQGRIFAGKKRALIFRGRERTERAVRREGGGLEVSSITISGEPGGYS